MAKFAGESVVAIHELTVNHDTRTYTGAEGYHYKILQTTCCTIGHFTDSSCISVVGNGYGYTEFLAQYLCEGDGSRPGKIYTIFNHTCEVVGVGCSDTYTVNLIFSIIGLDKAHDFCMKFVDVILKIGMLACLD